MQTAIKCFSSFSPRCQQVVNRYKRGIGGTTGILRDGGANEKPALNPKRLNSTPSRNPIDAPITGVCSSTLLPLPSDPQKIIFLADCNMIERCGDAGD